MVKSENLRNSKERMFEDIKAFSIKFGLPKLKYPGFLDPDDMVYRIDFIQEELDELIDATDAGDLEGALDALVDIMYVTLGTAWLMNLPIEKAWERVHHANMQKVRADSLADPRSKRNHPWDIVKPKDWVSPLLKDLIE